MGLESERRRASLPNPVAPWTYLRRAVQIAVVVFYLGLPVAHLKGFHWVSGNLAALGFGPIDLIEPAAGLSAALAAGSLTPMLALGMAPVILLALFLGPVFCSWICPWGLLSEMIDRTLRGGRKHPSRPRSPRARWLRPLLCFGLLVAGVLTLSPVVALVSAPRAITQLPLEVIYLEVLSPVTLGLLVALLAIEILAPRRIWCRTLCPVGTVANYLRLQPTMTIRFDNTTCRCPSVAQCEQRCPWGIDPRAMNRYDGCTNCLVCIDVCPSGSLMPGWGSR